MALYRATAQGQIPMTPEEEAEFLQDRQSGEIEKNQAEMLASFATAREIRERILNRLAGICAAAIHANDTEQANACFAARQSLLNIPQAPSVIAAQTPAQLKAAIKAEYASIVAAAPASLHNAFDAVDE